MVLAGENPPVLPDICLYDQPLEWVQEFKYLGFPVYANNKYHKCLPLDLASVYQVIGPMASVLHPDSMASLPLIQRVQAFSTMVEGKAMHNAQVADLDTKAIDVYTNKGLKAITGLISAAVSIVWRRRTENAVADRLANLAVAFQSSHFWSGDCSWDQALSTWQLHQSLGPTPYVLSESSSEPLPPVFHSPSQVCEFLESRLAGQQSMSPDDFRRLLADTFHRASLAPAHLHHNSHLYQWALTRCSTRPTRSAAPQHTFVVHIDTRFEAYWCSIVCDTQVRPPPPPQHPFPRAGTRGGPPFPNRTWINPALSSVRGTFSPPAPRPSRAPQPARYPLPAGGNRPHESRSSRSPSHYPRPHRRATSTPLPRTRDSCRPHASYSRPSHYQSPSHHHRSSPLRGPHRDELLVTVKWVDPDVSAHQLLETLRDVGLFIPAGTRVYAGHSRIRVLALSSPREVQHLLASKGPVLRPFRHISVNRGCLSSPRMLESERRAVWSALRQMSTPLRRSV